MAATKFLKAPSFFLLAAAFVFLLSVSLVHSSTQRVLLRRQVDSTSVTSTGGTGTSGSVDIQIDVDCRTELELLLSENATDIGVFRVAGALDPTSQGGSSFVILGETSDVGSLYKFELCKLCGSENTSILCTLWSGYDPRDPPQCCPPSNSILTYEAIWDGTYLDENSNTYVPTDSPSDYYTAEPVASETSTDTVAPETTQEPTTTETEIPTDSTADSETGTPTDSATDSETETPTDSTTDKEPTSTSSSSSSSKTSTSTTATTSSDREVPTISPTDSSSSIPGAQETHLLDNVGPALPKKILGAYWNLGFVRMTDTNKNAEDLAKFCMASRFSIIYLMAVRGFASTSSGISPILDNSLQCPSLDPARTVCKNMVSSMIQVCQAAQRRIVLHIDFSKAPIKNIEVTTARAIWDIFFAGYSLSRPFGNNGLNGIDIKIEELNLPYIKLLITEFRKILKENSYYASISVTLSCSLPMTGLVGSLMNSIIAESDWINVKMYDSEECGYRNGSGFSESVALWNAKAKSIFRLAVPVLIPSIIQTGASTNHVDAVDVSVYLNGRLGAALPKDIGGIALTDAENDYNNRPCMNLYLSGAALSSASQLRYFSANETLPISRISRYSEIAACALDFPQGTNMECSSTTEPELAGASNTTNSTISGGSSSNSKLNSTQSANDTASLAPTSGASGSGSQASGDSAGYGNESSEFQNSKTGGVSRTLLAPSSSLVSFACFVVAYLVVV